MKNHLRLALPPLASLRPESHVAFALLDRNGTVLRSGELQLAQLASAVPAPGVQAILHPGDAVIVTLNVPALSGNRLDLAVQSLVESMALSDTDALCIIHGPRQENGSAIVAWTDREPLLRAWRLLAEAGLNVQSLTPLPLALPAQDKERERQLSLPADERWRQPLPKWSFARPEWRPAADQRRWRAPLAWVAGAAALWILGLNIHAAQCGAEVRTLTTGIEQSVRRAFPEMSVIIDPLRQAENARDTLRLARGASSNDDFVPLALAAARVMNGAEGRVARLVYDKGELQLGFNEGFTAPPEASLNQAAAAQSLEIRKDDTLENTWIIRRARERSRGGQQ
ncbi:hypothetical protein CBF45_11625 [Bordetella sp. J329]|nr:hypothetical protein CBF45_11625 [Bordetella sp. J329]